VHESKVLFLLNLHSTRHVIVIGMTMEPHKHIWCFCHCFTVIFENDPLCVWQLAAKTWWDSCQESFRDASKKTCDPQSVECNVDVLFQTAFIICRWSTKWKQKCQVHQDKKRTGKTSATTANVVKNLRDSEFAVTKQTTESWESASHSN